MDDVHKMPSMAGMAELTLKVGDMIEDPGASRRMVVIDLPIEEFKRLTNDEVMERYMVPAMRQLVWQARTSAEKATLQTA